MTRQARVTDEARVRRLHAASEWVLLLNSEDCSEADTSAWLRWCDEDPENLDVFESLQRDWHNLDALRISSGADAVAAPTSKRNRKRAAFAAAACVLLAVAVAGYWTIERDEPRQLVAAQMNKTTTLPDGSSLVLGARTSVNVEFTGAARHLELSEGLAYFKVRHDAQRPFIVQAGDVSVKAVGTAFDVRREQDRVIVTVEEGVVEVTSAARSADAAPMTWRAEAGYRLEYSTQGGRGPAANIASVDPSTALKWRNGEFAYIWEPLGSVVADLNRYSSHRIVLADDRVAGLRYTGTVFATSVDDWLQAVQQTHPVRVRQAANGDIVLEIAQ